jgi:hypothetical protein
LGEISMGARDRSISFVCIPTYRPLERTVSSCLAFKGRGKILMSFFLQQRKRSIGETAENRLAKPDVRWPFLSPKPETVPVAVAEARSRTCPRCRSPKPENRLAIFETRFAMTDNRNPIPSPKRIPFNLYQSVSPSGSFYRSRWNPVLDQLGIPKRIRTRSEGGWDLLTPSRIKNPEAPESPLFLKAIEELDLFGP